MKKVQLSRTHSSHSTLRESPLTHLSGRHLAASLIAGLIFVTAEAALKPKYGPAHTPKAIPLAESYDYFQNPKNRAPDFWNLIGHTVPQFHGAACSVASVTMVLNAALTEKAKRNPRSADDRLVLQTELLEKVDAENWKKRILGPSLTRGADLDTLGNIVRAAFKKYGFETVEVKVIHADPQDPQARKHIREALLANEASAQDFVIANFDQVAFTDDAAVGHVSPVAAFDSKKDRVLIVDTDREYYEPYWVSEETFWKGVSTRDSSVGKSRGIVWVKVLDQK